MKSTSHLSAGIRGPRSLVVDRKSTRLNSSHSQISYAVFCLKKKTDRRQNDYRAKTITAFSLLSHAASHHGGYTSNLGYNPLDPMLFSRSKHIVRFVPICSAH